jgi:outer membrane receptor for monomeric catechols
MPARIIGTIAIVAVCLSSAVLALAGERPRNPPDRDPYADPAAPYKANRLQINGGMPRLNVPGQSTVLTREVLDDMNATSLRDAMRSTAGVTVGR